MLLAHRCRCLSLAVIGKVDDSSRSRQPAPATPALRKARGSAPLPTTDKLRATPAPAARNSAAFRNAAAPYPMEPTACSARVAKLPGSAPKAVTTTQCEVMRTSPPPSFAEPTEGPGGLVCARKASPYYTPLCVVTSFPVRVGYVRPPPHSAASWLRPHGRQAPPAMKHESRQRPTTFAASAVTAHAPARPTAQAKAAPNLRRRVPGKGRLPGLMLRMTWHTTPPTCPPLNAPHLSTSADVIGSCRRRQPARL